MRRIVIILLICGLSQAAFAQNADQQDIQQVKRSQVRFFGAQEVNNYKNEFNVGGRLNTDGWNAYLELEKRRNAVVRNLFQFEVGETKHPKENKTARGQAIPYPGGYVHYSTSRPYVYGKRNVFYQVRLGFGQRRTIGGKGNKNGVEVSAIYMGGVTLGLVKPYYLELVDTLSSGTYFAKYTPETEGDFLNENNILAGGGFKRGWDELEINPGLYARLGMRFDWAEFNEFVSAIEVGVTGSFYSKKVQIMVNNKASSFFYGAYVSLLFGKRW